jgi:heme-degrading monooxygenase HmoA
MGMSRVIGTRARIYRVAMETVITRVVLREGEAQDWDDAMRERLAAARDRKGWLGGQLLKPDEAPNERVIVGTWESREDWAVWHDDPAFRETRERLDATHAERSEIKWLQVLADVRAP